MSLLLFLIPLSSVFISCMAIYLTGTYDNLTGNVLCLAIILLVLSLIMFICGFINIISNIMYWQINEILDYTKTFLSVVMIIFSSRSLNKILN